MKKLTIVTIVVLMLVATSGCAHRSYGNRVAVDDVFSVE